MKLAYRSCLLASAISLLSSPVLAQLEEVIVTAQRRAESVQDAALAIDAITTAGLMRAGVTDAISLGRSVPALTITSSGGSNASLYMRGVGNEITNGYVDSAIALSYDGVYLGRSSAATGAIFYDLERVEVLKGPQGTLYGRNATGGAINFLPAKPVLGETSGHIMGAVGNFDAHEVQGAINLPLGDHSALRIAASIAKRDGYNDDDTDDRDDQAVRVQWLVEPTEALSIRIGGDYTKVDAHGPGSHYSGHYTPGNYQFVPSGLSEDAGVKSPSANAWRQTQLSAPGFGFLDPITDNLYVDNEFMGLNAEINWHTDAGTLTIIPAWRKVNVDSVFTGPAFNSAKIFETDEQYSLEVRFASDNDGPLNYLIGAYYFDEKLDGGPNTFNQEYVLPLQRFEQETESWAVFSQVTWDFADDKRLVLGARYTDDHKEIDAVMENFIVFCGGLPPNNIVPPASFGAGCAAPGALPNFPTLSTTAETLDWLVAGGWVDPGTTLVNAPGQPIPLLNGVGTILKTYEPNGNTFDKTKVTWKATFEWDIADDSMLYVSYETGYRAGGLQPAEGKPTYKPEYLDAITIGSKNRFLDGRLQLNAEAFYWTYEDQQITYFHLVGPTLVNATDNVGESTIKGIDIDMQWAVTDNTLINAKAQYLRATYDDLHFTTAAPRDNFACPFTFTGEVSGGAPVKDIDCSGKDAVHAPKWAFNFGIEQTFPLGRYDLIAAVQTLWRDDKWGGFEYVDHHRIDSYWSTNVDLTLEPRDGNWAVTLYARNLEDDRYKTSTQLAPTGQGVETRAAPLTYGARVLYNF